MNSLDYLLFNGIGGIPYATFGMVGLVVGVFTYATIVDFVNAEPEIQESQPTNPFSAATLKVSSLLGFQEEKPPSSPSLFSASEPGEQYKIMGGRRSKKHSRSSIKSKPVTRKRKQS